MVKELSFIADIDSSHVLILLKTVNLELKL